MINNVMQDWRLRFWDVRGYEAPSAVWFRRARGMGAIIVALVGAILVGAAYHLSRTWLSACLLHSDHLPHFSRVNRLVATFAKSAFDFARDHSQRRFVKLLRETVYRPSLRGVDL
jgi:hypothetical protein